MASNNNGEYIVGAALALIGLDRILSYLSTPAPPPPAPPPPPPPPPKRLPVVCKHLVEIYHDFRRNYTDKDSTTFDRDSTIFAALEKHCTLLGHGLSYKTIAPEEWSTMPNPFDLTLQSYTGCMSDLPHEWREKYICEKKYSKMLRQLIDAGKK